MKNRIASMLLVAFVLVFNPLIIKAEVHAQDMNWSCIGPLGGKVTSLIGDPTNSQVLYMASGGGMIYKSGDRGITWAMITPKSPFEQLSSAEKGNESEMITALAALPKETTHLFAGLDGGDLLHSGDGGSSWNIALNKPTDTDYAFQSLYRTSNTAITEIIISPFEPTTLYASAAKGSIFKSTDEGNTWKEIQVFKTDEQENSIRSIALDPTNVNTLFIATWEGPYKSIDGGNTWTLIKNGLNIPATSTIAIDPANPQVLFTGSDTIYKSEDGGNTWKALLDASQTGFVSSIRIDSKDSKTIYGLSNSPKNLLFRSNDAGSTWKELSETLPHSMATVFSIDESDSSILYLGTEYDGLYRSTDKGETWTQSNQGFCATDISTMVADSTNANHLLAGTYSGLYATEDRGKNWTRITSDEVNYINTVYFDPQNPLRIILGSGNGILWVTTDGGKTWKEAGNGIASPSITCITVDSKTPSTLYVGSYTNGIFKSVDDGATWKAINKGLSASEGNYVTTILIDPQNSSHLFLSEFGGGIFQSTDAGENWLEYDSGLTTRNITAVSIDASNTSNLFAATDQGLFKVNSTVGLWERVSLSDTVDDKTAITALFHDQSNAQRLIIAADKQLLTSNDGGSTWKLDDSGLPHFVINQITAHPTTNALLYVSTKGGGIYVSSASEVSEPTSTPPTSPTLDLTTKTPQSN